MPRRRGAVVIGVNKTGGLPVLEASVCAANAFAEWLGSEGFEVKKITDAAAPVTPQQIAEAVAYFVAPGNCAQLVIYFSGHGYWKNDAELWLLTDAPADANAAVSWAETAEFAKDCGIPNVVLVSDACRSVPGTPRALKVRGSIIFPNEDTARSRAQVDKFMAAAVGTAAYEVSVDSSGRKENAFTRCFLRAFSAPDQDMIMNVTEDGRVMKVVPNRRLGKYLQREVAMLLSSIDVRLDQVPDAEVLSDDNVYIGLVRRAPPSAHDFLASSSPTRRRLGDIADESSIPGPSSPGVERRRPTSPTVHMRNVAAAAFGHALGAPPPAAPEVMRAIEQLARQSGFNDILAQARTVSDIAQFNVETGFAVLGAAVADAIVVNGRPPVIHARGDGRNPAVIDIEPQPSSANTVMIQFADGRGTALAALQGFVAHVLVEGGRVVNVSYVPSDSSMGCSNDRPRRERLVALRAAAAAAARIGVFRLDDELNAAALAEHIRVTNGLDPALGLYAAYAYSEADRREDIDSVFELVRRELAADLFDIALLARRPIARVRGVPPCVPFCPMLTQGWNLLRARGIALPRVLEDAQDELEQGLWTTFKPLRTRLIATAIEQGDLQ